MKKISFAYNIAKTKIKEETHMSKQLLLAIDPGFDSVKICINNHWTSCRKARILYDF